MNYSSAEHSTSGTLAKVPRVPLTFWSSWWEKQKRDSGCVHRGVRADEPKAGCSPAHSASGESLCRSPPAAGARDADGLHTHHTWTPFRWNSDRKTLVFISSHWPLAQCEWTFDLKSFSKKLTHKNRKGFCTDLYDSPAHTTIKFSFLTQNNVLAFKVEVFKNHNNLAPHGCRFCPAAHLAALDVVPENVKHIKTFKQTVSVLTQYWWCSCLTLIGTWH